MKWLFFAVILGLIRFSVPRVTLGTSNGVPYNLSQAQGLCTSAIGQIGQAFSQTAAVDCGRVADIYDWLNAVTVLAVVCLFLFAHALSQPGKSSARQN